MGSGKQPYQGLLKFDEVTFIVSVSLQFVDNCQNLATELDSLHISVTAYFQFN